MRHLALTEQERSSFWVASAILRVKIALKILFLLSCNDYFVLFIIENCLVHICNYCIEFAVEKNPVECTEIISFCAANEL